jgi:hypothetical protein
MKETFTRAELVQFGRYLLSEERKNRLAGNYEHDNSCSFSEREKEVYDTDIANALPEEVNPE